MIEPTTAPIDAERANDLIDLVEYFEAHGQHKVTLGRVAWCIRQTAGLPDGELP